MYKQLIVQFIPVSCMATERFLKSWIFLFLIFILLFVCNYFTLTFYDGEKNVKKKNKKINKQESSEANVGRLVSGELRKQTGTTAANV